LTTNDNFQTIIRRRVVAARLPLFDAEIDECASVLFVYLTYSRQFWDLRLTTLDAANREIETAILECCAHPLAAFANFEIGQADD
jgi:hypothetical protein